ncbi:MAG: hypothetical protein ABEI98_07170 [Halorhabdus sp.]
MGGGVAVLLFGGYLLWKIVGLIDFAVEYRLASETPVVNLSPGDRAKVTGTVRPDGDSVWTPIGGRQVQAVSHTIEALREDDDTGGEQFREIEQVEETTGFRLEGADGSEVFVESNVDLYLDDDSGTRETGVSSLAVDADQLPFDADRKRQTRHTQRTVEGGDELTVYGTATPAEDAAARIADGDAADHFAVVDSTDALPSITLLTAGAVLAVAFTVVGLALTGRVLLSLIAG